MAEIETKKVDIPVPSGITASFKDGVLKVKGKKGELERKFVHPRVVITLHGGKVTIACASPRRVDAALFGTWQSHVKNMLKGVADGYQYKMRIVFSHFPIKTLVKGNELVIENFLGERHPRKASIIEGVTAKISGDTITLEGADKEKVGQTAANIEKVTKIKDYDPRVFQDGIYLTSRGE